VQADCGTLVKGGSADQLCQEAIATVAYSYKKDGYRQLNVRQLGSLRP